MADNPNQTHGPLGRLARWIGSWAVVQELAAFGRDAASHYRLDQAAAAAGRAGREIRMDYSQSSSRLRLAVRLTLLVLAVLFIGAVVYQAWYNPDLSRKLHLPMPTDVFRARKMDLTDISGGGGQVQPSQTVNLSSWIVGQVTKVPVNLGDLINPNTVLYECDPAPLDAALTAAEQKANMMQYAVQLAEKQDTGVQAMRKQGIATEVDVLTSSSNLAQARANLAAAQQALIEAQTGCAADKVKSPVTGIVMARMINPGERIIVSQSVMVLGELTDVYFLANIGEDKIASVRAGLKAEVVFESFPGEVFHGDVFFVDPKTNPQTRSFTAYIKIPNPRLKLKPGISGFARIVEQKHVLVVPDTAVMNPVGESATVFVVTADNRAVLRTVRYGMITQGWAEIDDGLEEGDLVVIAGPLYLKNGDKIHYHLEGS
jgi:membrane fusion protein (multidrug efflux system)